MIAQNDWHGTPLDSNPFGSVWSKARYASAQLGVQWIFSNGQNVFLTINEDTIITDRKTIFKKLRTHCRLHFSDSLSKRKYQGKTFHSFSKDKASSFFNRTGDFLWVTNWKFIHQARLGTIQCSAHDFLSNNNSKVCRRCNYEHESLQHILQCCKSRMSMRTQRHNCIVNRLKDAALHHWELFSENRLVAGSFRPDLLLHKGDEEALVLDVIIPFENNPGIFQQKSIKSTKL